MDKKTAGNIVLAKCGEKYKVERLAKFIRRCFFIPQKRVI